MQFPESWLREFCNPPLSTNELANVLTMAGLEVEEVRPVAPAFTGVVVGQVLATGAASGCRPAEGLPGRCGPSRATHHCLRRTECRGRPQGAMRFGGRGVAGQRPWHRCRTLKDQAQQAAWC